MQASFFLFTILNTQIALSDDCWVPSSDNIVFDILSSTYTEIVDSSGNYLSNSAICSFINSSWEKIEDAIRIWDREDGSTTGVNYFREKFLIIGKPVAGNVLAGCDDSVRLYVNGVDTGCKSINHTDLFNCDILNFLVPGENIVLFRTTNSFNRGGLVFKISIESEF